MVFSEIDKAILNSYLTIFPMPMLLCNSDEELFDMAMQNSDSNIHYWAGCFFVQKNMFGNTLALWHKAAENNHQKAKYELGFIYYFGLLDCCVEQDKEKGMQLWRESWMPQFLTTNRHLDDRN